MIPDKLKQVGTLGGEPVYEVPVEAMAQLVPQPRKVPVTAGANPNAAHRMTCLPCLVNSLIDPIEEMEEFLKNTVARLREVDTFTAIAHADSLLALSEEREMLLAHAAFATEALASLKTIVGTAARIL